MVKFPGTNLYAFNWTKVELKRRERQDNMAPGNAFNWTKVELKRDEKGNYDTAKVSFNWTKVELKPDKVKSFEDACKLLIELR